MLVPKIMAPLMPCMTRAAMSMAGDVESAAINDDSVNTSVPRVKIFLRP